jgi:hypothetical protein
VRVTTKDNPHRQRSRFPGDFGLEAAAGGVELLLRGKSGNFMPDLKVDIRLASSTSSIFFIMLVLILLAFG